MNRNIKIILALCIGVGLGLLMENNFLISQKNVEKYSFFKKYNLIMITIVNIVTFESLIDKQLSLIN